MRHFIIFLSLLISNLMLSQVAVVKGKVVEKETNKPLSNVAVKLENDEVTTVFTDSLGLYEITVTYLKNEVIYFQKPGYVLIRKPISLKNEEIKTVNISLQVSAAIKIKEKVIKTKQNKEESKEDINTEIVVAQQQANPSGNVEQTLKYQGMGVGGNNELGSQFSVRGGSFDENLIYVNDFEIYRPLLIRNAQQEGLSFANSSMISNMKFSSGGFSPEYGDKMSSVLDIQYKKPKKWAGSIEAGLLGANGHLEAALFNKRLNIISGVRYRNNAYLLGSQEVKGQYTPMFLDIQNNIHFQISKAIDFESISVFSMNRFNIIPEDRETNFGLANFALTYRVYYQGQEVDNYTNWMQGGAVTIRPSERWKIKLSAAHYQVTEKQNYDITGEYAIGEVETDVKSTNYQGFKSVLGSGIFQNWGREKYEAKMSHANLYTSYILGKHIFKLGAKLKDEEFGLRINSWDRLDSSGYNIPNNGQSIQVLNPIRSEYTLKGQRLEAFLLDQVNFQFDSSKSLHIIGGVRANYWTVNKELFFSPRLQILYKPNKRWTLYTSGGSYNQAPFIREMIDEKGILNPNVKSQKSIHCILGSDLIFDYLKRPFKFTVEGYYKFLSDLNPYQYNNVLVRYSAKNTVSGYARGLDFRLQGEFVKDAESWINIGILDTKELDPSAVFKKYTDSLGNQVYDRSYSQYPIKDSFWETRGYIQRPNNQFLMINIFFQDYMPKMPNFKANIALTLASGLPFGVPNSEVYRNKFNLLAYKRLDIGMSAKFLDREKKENSKALIKSLWVSLDIFNAVDFSNQVSMSWIQDYSNNQFAVPNYLTGRRINAKVQFNF